MKVVLIPGWHETSGVMKTFCEGRRGHPGLNALGYDCAIFPGGRDALQPRITRFAKFLDDLREREADAFPIATIGYSAGGLINRGFLRAYPERVHEIAATVQIAAPNTGIISNYIAGMLRVMRIPHKVLEDLDVASPFLLWLNGTDGSWVPTERKNKRRWQLNGRPWVAPEGHRLLSIAGVLPHEHERSDGVVTLDSATLEGHAPSFAIAEPTANHLNLGAVYSNVALLARGFRGNDRIWTRVVATTDRFLRGEPLV